MYREYAVLIGLLQTREFPFESISARVNESGGVLNFSAREESQSDISGATGRDRVPLSQKLSLFIGHVPKT
jgi:hypothetical protein